MDGLAEKILELLDEQNALLRELLRESRGKRRAAQKRQTTITKKATGQHVSDPILKRQMRDRMKRVMGGR